MQRILAATLIFSLCLTSCKILDGAADSQELGPDTRWTLTAIEQRKVKLDSAYLVFDIKENQVKGKAACNGFGSEYELANNQRITFSGINSTKMFCDGLMDEEHKILTNLSMVRRYEIRTDRLYLFGDEKLLLTFKR